MNITFYTGAGVSAESGVPMFRGSNGLYTESGRFVEIAPSWFDINSKGFSDTVGRLSELFEEAKTFINQKCQPNKAHDFIAKWQDEVTLDGGEFHIITTNVDNLHERAGSETIKVHGDLYTDRLINLGCCDWSLPDVVLFGESKKHQSKMWDAIKSADIFVVVGSSLSLYGDSAMIYFAKEKGAKTIEINPTPTGHPAFDVVIPKSATKGVQELYTLISA